MNAAPKINPAKTIICGGYARLPASMCAQSDLNVVSIELEIDPDNRRIVDAACSVQSPLAKKLLLGLLIGHDLDDEISGITQELKLRYHGSVRRALIACLEDAVRQYETYTVKEIKNEQSVIKHSQERDQHL